MRVLGINVSARLLTQMVTQADNELGQFCDVVWDLLSRTMKTVKL